MHEIGDVRPWSLAGRRSDSEDMESFEPHRWTLRFETRETEDHCDIVVHLEAGDRSLSGYGRSRRNPTDPSVPQVGEELAAARALHDLARHLTDDAWRMIESYPSENT